MIAREILAKMAAYVAMRSIASGVNVRPGTKVITARLTLMNVEAILVEITES